MSGAGASVFETGQAVWLNGRSASFCYALEARSAVIRYDGEPATRVVLLRKLAAAPPSAGNASGEAVTRA
jgi:hypothetical protein